jgi:hypothetical protein
MLAASTGQAESQSDDKTPKVPGSLSGPIGSNSAGHELPLST